MVEGLKHISGVGFKYVAIFDADFEPPRWGAASQGTAATSGPDLSAILNSLFTFIFTFAAPQQGPLWLLLTD
jgi:hypothetical protein